MPLYSKSIQDPSSITDGIRICIMRKPGANALWDIWMPTLAPSLALLKSYQAGTTDWNWYVQQFTKEVITDKHDHIKLLVDMAKKHTITILCWEKTPDQCHRRLVIEEALHIEPTLPVIIK